jgi:adenosylcobinamide-GDP ribazoletransferase
MADGFGGGRSREDVLRIMRDPSVGSYGATAIVLLVMLKVACLSTLLEQRTAAATLFVAPVLGRWSMALLGQWLPYARTQGGLGAVVTDQAARGTLLVATPLAAVLTAAASGRKGLVFWGVTIAVTVMIGRVCQRRLGGFTGDTLGACAELSEAAVWLAAVMIAS